MIWFRALRGASGGKDEVTRTPQEFEALATDPAIGNKVTPGTIAEREAALKLETKGEIPGPITRDLSGAGDFIDANGNMWDVKSFNSNFPVKKGGFTVDKSMKTIEESLEKGEKVIINPTNMSSEDVQALKNALKGRGLGEEVVKWSD